MKILVTGGTGYIGSHTCAELMASGHEVVVADNLCNSTRKTLKEIELLSGEIIPFHEMDATDEARVELLFKHHSFDGVMHFAGFKSVRESVEKPLSYYRNNILSTITLAEACVRHHVTRFVFSSSATVYGENPSPLREDMPLLPTANPYGETKVICERILRDTVRSSPHLGVTILRYFNPVGAHSSGAIGENPRGTPNNLMPFVTQVAAGKLQQLRVFGKDYDTPDGTAIRDYIHVVDLAKGHVAALEHQADGVHLYNLGTGRGTSVLELIKTFEEVNRISIPFEFVGRRAGDLPVSYADVTKAEKHLRWKAQHTLEDMVRDAWRFEQGHRE